MRLFDARRWAQQLRDERGWFVVVGREAVEGYVVMTATLPDGRVHVLRSAAEVQRALTGKFP